MREAALTLALGRDDFAPSFLARLVGALRGLRARLRRRSEAARALAHLAGLDAERLADVGLSPDDLPLVGSPLDPLAETRRLARLARARRERWTTA